MVRGGELEVIFLQLNQLPNSALCDHRLADALCLSNFRTYNQTQEIVEHWNRLRDNPGDNPDT